MRDSSWQGGRTCCHAHKASARYFHALLDAFLDAFLTAHDRPSLTSSPSTPARYSTSPLSRAIKNRPGAAKSRHEPSPPSRRVSALGGTRGAYNRPANGPDLRKPGTGGPFCVAESGKSITQRNFSQCNFPRETARAQTVL